MTVLHQLLTVDPHFMRRGCAGPHQILHFATCLDVRPARSLQRVAHAQKKFTFHHMFGRRKRTISADGCCGQRSFAFHHTTCFPIRHVRSPQRVAQGQSRPAFRHTRLSLPPERNRRTGEVWFCRSSDTIWSPGIWLNSCVATPV